MRRREERERESARSERREGSVRGEEDRPKLGSVTHLRSLQALLVSRSIIVGNISLLFRVSLPGPGSGRVVLEVKRVSLDDLSQIFCVGLLQRVNLQPSPAH